MTQEQLNEWKEYLLELAYWIRSEQDSITNGKEATPDDDSSNPPPPPPPIPHH